MLLAINNQGSLVVNAHVANSDTRRANDKRKQMLLPKNAAQG
jgi:hypothetical protein